MSLDGLRTMLPTLGRIRQRRAWLAWLVIAAQLGAIAVPCPVDPAWKIAAARALEAPPPCPGHAQAHAQHAEPRAFMVFHCPCGCGDAPPPATGAHHSRVALVPGELALAALQPGAAPAPEPTRFAPQAVPSGLRHVPRPA